MHRTRPLVAACAGLALTAMAPTQDLPRSVRPRVLFLTHSAGFTHAVVERVERGKLAIAERELRRAAGEHFDVVASQDCGELAPERLASYDAVLFYTTGELPIPREHAEHLVEWVRQGGAFCGVHSATDTFYDVPAYGEMIGGRFDGHPWNQRVGVRVERPDHPIVAHLGDRFETHDEIYQFRDWQRDAGDVLLSLDPASVDIERGKRADHDYALAWCRTFGAGRVFYDARGHGAATWADRGFLRTLLQGLRWTLDAGDRFASPPDGAVRLFDGESTAAWQQPDGAPIRWAVADGALVVEPGKGSIQTLDSFTDFVLHVGFRVPHDDRQGQSRGNSGVYLQRRYEVQILDSAGRPPEIDGCGALYRQRPPDVCCAREPGTWQDYWIRFRGARFAADGTKSANARISVWWNGVLVHDDVELTAKTGAGWREGPEPGPLLLQDHGSAVAFRDVWILPL
ncbi:MAG: ThuA domain-containing protein [Planctomycetes bacterium]|nr:ThuA domain-containing protein [Planctomycetota bacterium]